MKKIVIINGPNLNLLGKRNPQIYGNKSFESYFKKLHLLFKNVDLKYFQSNVEGELITLLHSIQEAHGILLNAGGYTHTSVALGDAVESISIPVVEIHISNIFQRDNFRQVSFIAPHCKGSISGFGLDSYRIGIMSFL